MKDVELFNDHFQNYKTYGIPKAQLIILSRMQPRMFV